ncbi:MAG: DUF1634 domain-containing protein [Firmicutes bacterium]|nr:DUF1634 domain-containing protein [Bacillota bacterium]
MPDPAETQHAVREGGAGSPLYRGVHQVFAVGMVVSALLLGLGLILSLLAGRTLGTQGVKPLALLGNLPSGDPGAFLSLGLLALLLTPVAGVLRATLQLARERQGLNALAGLAVLAILTYGILRAFVG